MESQDEDKPVAEVGVTLGDCSPEDARAVLDLLERSFPTDGRAGRTVEGGQAVTVWSATLDAAEPATAAAAQAAQVRLRDVVSVTLQGGPRAVERVQAALAGYFTVEQAGAVSGDQETQIGLRVRS
ncbi:hypothetical protein OG625_03545 [Streptomyces sp. NBC_01351]|uniref:hypothetical protein n=1 Tax=Streptomyces sp. NBC_01351 TaxID=2903833 RepID=UPI002E310C31|nr:hypothetical protein [Streptomyces sp. NBC_01351]